VQAEIAQVQAAVQRVREQSRRYLALERPLTPDEAAQVRALARVLNRQAAALRRRLQHLRTSSHSPPGAHHSPCSGDVAGDGQRPEHEDTPCARSAPGAGGVYRFGTLAR